MLYSTFILFVASLVTFFSFNSVSAEVTLTSTEIVDDSNSPWGPFEMTQFPDRIQRMDLAPNGTLGIVYRDSLQGSTLIRYRTLLAEYYPDGSVSRRYIFNVRDYTSREVPPPALLYDGSSQAHLFWVYDGNIYHYQNVDTTWENTWTLAKSDYMSLVGNIHGPDGTPYLVISDYDSVSRERVLEVGQVKSGQYEEVLRTPYAAALSQDGYSFEEWFGFAIDASGSLHCCYSSIEPYGDPQNLPRPRLNYGKYQEGTWVVEVVRQGSSVDDRPVGNGAIALDGNGTPHVLSKHTTHSSTGSMRDSKLYFYRRNGQNDWPRELIADSADGYVGQDGNKYTGEYPMLAFDSGNRPHVSFSDVASWHWPCIEDMPEIECNDQVAGQARYAWKEGSNWRTMTLHQQAGRSSSPNPLNMFTGTQLVGSPGGSHIYVCGMEVVHESNTYAYDRDAEQSYRLLCFEALNSQGSDVPEAAADLIARLLGHDVPLDNLDDNMDGSIDAADLVGILD